MSAEDLALREQLSLVRRAYELRKARKIGIVLVDCGEVYMCDSEADPWGTKRWLSWERFQQVVEEAEARAGWVVAKPAASERRRGGRVSAASA